MLNGRNAELTVKLAAALAFALILAISVIVVFDKPIPQGFDLALTGIVTAILGFLAGSRVVTPDVSAELKTQPLTEHEKHLNATRKETEDDHAS